MRAARETWFEGQPDLDPERLAFIDETGASTKMDGLRGRAPRGERLRAGVPHGHWKTTTFVGGLRLSGLGAPMVLDGPMIGAWFRAYVEQVLAPTMAPGHVVILDNLPSHKGPAVRRAVEARGASLLFLPPYSLDFNPVENAFAKLKALLRKATARTITELWRVIGESLDAFSPNLTWLSLHRCLERHGISRLPELKGDKPKSSASRLTQSAMSTSTSPRSVRRRGSCACSWPSIARPSSHSSASLRAPEDGGGPFASRDFIKVVPCRMHTVMTDNGIQFTSRRRDVYDSCHIFDRICADYGIEHRLTKVNHP